MDEILHLETLDCCTYKSPRIHGFDQWMYQDVALQMPRGHGFDPGFLGWRGMEISPGERIMGSAAPGAAPHAEAGAPPGRQLPPHRAAVFGGGWITPHKTGGPKKEGGGDSFSGLSALGGHFQG